MQLKAIFILVFVLLVLGKNILAQPTTILKDTTKIYKEIETFSSQRKITKYLYRLVFMPVASNSKGGKNDVHKKVLNKSYRSFEGKIIRNIEIETLDPFGYSIGDTIEVDQYIISKSANTLHIKSKKASIRNLLLIRQNQVFDSLLVRESERLVRSRPYILDVSFYVKLVSKKSDSVDIFIRVLDNWSLSAKVEGSPTSPTFNLTEKNFLGLGHESKSNLSRYFPTNEYAYNSSYYIPNIRNTYVNSTLAYSSDRFRNNSSSFAVDRPFYSSFAKWAAGASLSQQFHKDSLRINDSLVVLQSFKLNIQDYWAGYAFKILKGNTEYSRTTNLISSVRFLKTNYLQKPDENFDTLHIYSDEIFYMAALGISTRTYIQDRFIFRYGVIEDVPIGKVFSLTGGYQERNKIGRLYLGSRVSFSKFYPWGYLSSNVEYGTFYRSSHTEQGIFTLGVNYFTGLLEIGDWKIRQFAKSQITFGLNRLSYENLSINDGYGIDGFNSDGLTGTNRFLFSLQTQSYAPWNFIGFRFGPYLSYSLGMLSSDKRGFANSKMYQQISLGVLVKNEYLIINNFQFSISFFPIIPGNGLDVFKANSFRTSDFGFRDFGVGKPGTIEFR